VATGVTAGEGSATGAIETATGALVVGSEANVAIGTSGAPDTLKAADGDGTAAGGPKAGGRAAAASAGPNGSSLRAAA